MFWGLLQQQWDSNSNILKYNKLNVLTKVLKCSFSLEISVVTQSLCTFEHWLASVQNVPSLTTKFDNVRPLWDIRCWAFLNLCEDHSTLRRPLCPVESQDLSNPFTFRLITLSFKPLTLFWPNYARQRKPHQTSRLAYVCKQLGRSVPTSCLILFSCRPAAV